MGHAILHKFNRKCDVIKAGLIGFHTIHSEHEMSCYTFSLHFQLLQSILQTMQRVGSGREYIVPEITYSDVNQQEFKIQHWDPSLWLNLWNKHSSPSRKRFTGFSFRHIHIFVICIFFFSIKVLKIPKTETVKRLREGKKCLFHWFIQRDGSQCWIIG